MKLFEFLGLIQQPSAVAPPLLTSVATRCLDLLHPLLGRKAGDFEVAEDAGSPVQGVVGAFPEDLSGTTFTVESAGLHEG